MTGPSQGSTVPFCTGGIHGLRHTWATLALHEGIDIQAVSERLNHSSTHVTCEIYTHVTAPTPTDAAERVAATIFRDPNQQLAKANRARSRRRVLWNTGRVIHQFLDWAFWSG
jgi:Phage integrase family